VIAPTLDQLRTLLRLLPADEYYVDADHAEAALHARTQFNVIDVADGWKIDLIVQKARAFSRAEFERRVRIDLDGLAVDIASAEDTILSKLEWAKLGSSERQLRDVAGIVQLRGAALDRTYIEGWVARLGLGDEWRRARIMSGESS
jgi:hypothetical protein